MNFIKEWLKGWSLESKENFEKNHRIKSFEEYLLDLLNHPYLLSRNSVQYLVDMLEFFGEKKVYSSGMVQKRFTLFDQDFPYMATKKIVGHESTILKIYSVLKDFVIEGGIDKIVLLHGPSNSGKSLILEWLMIGLEEYSRKNEGCLYTFHWIFPIESGKRLGFGEKNDIFKGVSSFANLSSEQTAFRIGCDVNDSPLLLIPPKRRLPFLQKLLENAPEAERERFVPTKYILEGELCSRCRQIFDSLHDEYGGDVEKILRHVQVRRLFISRKYQRGAVVISPQESPDAAVRLLSTDVNWEQVPSVLQHLTLEQIQGGLTGSNNGILEFSDFLSRPPEMNKYLLSLITSGRMDISQNSWTLNTTIFATAIEESLDLFKNKEEFHNFKGILTFIPVPYLLERTKEQILHYETLKKIAEFKHVDPLLHYSSALIAVLSRLFKPQLNHFEPKMRETVSKITPYEKAIMYDSFFEFSPELVSFTLDKIAILPDLIEEFAETQYYEGRMGFSPKDFSEIFYEQAYKQEEGCMTIIDFLDGVYFLTKNTSLYRFLDMKPEGNYNDFGYILDITRKEHSNIFEDILLHVLGYSPNDLLFGLLKGYYYLLLNKGSEKKLEEHERLLKIDGKRGRKRIKKEINEGMNMSDWGFIPSFCKEYKRIKKGIINGNLNNIKSEINSMSMILLGREKELPKDIKDKSVKTIDILIEKYGFCANCLYENLSTLIEEKYSKAH